jgi:hypothetical protein
MPVAWHEPTRDGEKAIPVVGNVPRRKARAPKLAERAGKRGTMATMGQAVTATLTCAVQALGSPKAALLGLCWALMASQAVAVMPAAWRAVHGCAQVQQGIAASSLALESAQTSDGMIVAIPRPHWRVVYLQPAGNSDRPPIQYTAPMLCHMTATSSRYRVM